MLRFDAHVHSSISDGTDTPTELMTLASESALDVIALVDHDTFAGWDEAADAVSATGVGLIRGVELSTSYKGISGHLLAYLPDPEDPNLRRTMDKIRNSRHDRLYEMVERIKSDYPLVTWQLLEERAESFDTPWGRPHLADALVDMGYIPDRDAAFATILRPDSPYYVNQWAPHPATMVEIIRGAGGVPVFAHPVSNRQRYHFPDQVVGEMVDAGLFALERDHREHDKLLRYRVDQMANKLGLEVTGGSDYHGTGKPNLLGENLTEPEVLQQILEQGRIEGIGV